MRTKRMMVPIAGVVGAAALVSGCSAGEGAPEGWTTMRGGSVVVAHPKGWDEVHPDAAQASAVLRGAGGRLLGEITVRSGGAGARGGTRGGTGGGTGGGAGTGAIRRGTGVRAMTIGGRPAKHVGYIERLPGGGRNRAVEITTTDSHGRPVLVRVTGSDTDDWPDELRQIVNSIDVG